MTGAARERPCCRPPSSWEVSTSPLHQQGSRERQQRLKQDQRKGGPGDGLPGSLTSPQPGWHRPRFSLHIPSMAFASDVQLVRVITNVIVDGIATKKFWAAAVPRQLAVGIVLDALLGPVVI